MIRLNEVAKKLEDILNGVDPEINSIIPEGNPTGFDYRVATEGFHIDKIYDIQEGKNFIPVFISSMGGQFNPVPDLMQANYVIPIAIYFPVRFKNDLFQLNEYLAKVFVGRQLNYGANSGRALSNISVATFGEIVEMDLLEQFKKWQETTYKKPIEVMEPMLQMNINLYLSTLADEFVYGNDAKATLTIDIEDETWPEEDRTDVVTFLQQSIQSNSDPAAQQILGTNETEALPVATSYGSGFSIYVKKTTFYKKLIKKWFDGDSQTLSMVLKFEFLGEIFEKTCFMQAVNLVVQKGEPVTITLSFTKKADVTNGGL